MNKFVAMDEPTRRFVHLASQPVLAKADHEEAIALMRALKKSGMSNEEIAKLSNGRWSTSTVKGYTKGVGSAVRGQWRDAVDVMKDIISGDLSLDEVARAVALNTELAHYQVSVDDVALVLDAARAASTDVRRLVEQLKNFIEHGLSPEKAAEVLTLKEVLEKEGMPMESVPRLAEAARKFGGIDGALEAVAGYGSLKQLEETTEAAEEKRAMANEQCAVAERKLAETRSKGAKERRPLEALLKAKSLGFGETELGQLARASEKAGGPRAVFEVFDGYADLIELENKKEKATQDLARSQAMVDKLDAQYAHLKAVVELCSRLIREFGFGFDAIATIHSVAQRYGEPTAVLKALEVYGSLQSLAQTEQEIRGRIQEKQQLLEQLEGRYKEALDMMDALNGKCVAVGTEVARIESKLAGSAGVRNAIDFLWNPASVGFEEGGPTALAIAVSFRRWVERHQQRLPRGYSIKSGMDFLIGDLGG